jgi:2Fe-2S ferredoxin
MVKLVVTDKDGREVAVDARAGLSIMENIRTLPRSVEAICGGMCACATCHVYVDPTWVGKLPRRSYEEQSMLQGHASFDPERSRLSCQIVVREAFDGLRLTVAPDES